MFAAVDDVIARGKRDDWKLLRDVAASDQKSVHGYFGYARHTYQTRSRSVTTCGIPMSEKSLPSGSNSYAA